jgi:hypothetical protein
LYFLTAVGHIQNFMESRQTTKSKHKICRSQIENEKIVEHWNVVDQLNLLHQTGTTYNGNVVLAALIINIVVQDQMDNYYLCIQLYMIM